MNKQHLLACMAAFSAANGLAGCDDGGSDNLPEPDTAMMSGGAFSQQRCESGHFPGRDYYVYAPDTLPEALVPLVVYLHGCNQTAEEAFIQTGWDEFADVHGFVVMFPEQFRPSAEEDAAGGFSDGNGTGCWNWFRPEHQVREGGEPAAIACATRQTMQAHNIDPKRVYISGSSAGGAMTSIMGATYPDLYSALGIIAGASYPGGADVSGFRAWQAMGQHARRMPAIVVHGTLDNIAPFPLGVAAVRQWLGTNDLVDDGTPNLSVSQLPATVEHVGFDESLLAGVGSVGEFCVSGVAASPCVGGLLGPEGDYPHSIERYTDADGQPLLEFWIIHGGTHNYYGGDTATKSSDPLGPDVSEILYDFFSRLPRSGEP